MSERTSNRIFDIVNVTFIALFVLFCLAPFIHVIAVSLRLHAGYYFRGSYDFPD